MHAQHIGSCSYGETFRRVSPSKPTELFYECKGWIVGKVGVTFVDIKDPFIPPSYYLIDLASGALLVKLQDKKHALAAAQILTERLNLNFNEARSFGGGLVPQLRQDMHETLIKRGFFPNKYGMYVGPCLVLSSKDIWGGGSIC